GKITDGKALHLDLHLNRILESAQKLNFKSFDLSSLKLNLDRSIRSVDSALFRLTVTRIQQQRGYAVTEPDKHFVALQINPPLESNNANLSLSLSQVPASKNTALAGIKHLNRLENVLASGEIKSLNNDMILCCDGAVISASKANLFLNIDDVWCTPDLSYAGVKGIMRELVIQYFKNAKIEYRIRNISISELERVKTAFISNCIVGIRAVERIEKQALELSSVNLLKSSFNEYLSKVSQAS
ncbi:MAG: aminotransferase class IV, partial [Kangiellaceae bacterium]|nr:aminotransferase class IV [Kangiellaceae bacterium]